MLKIVRIASAWLTMVTPIYVGSKGLFLIIGDITSPMLKGALEFLSKAKISHSPSFYLGAVMNSKAF